MTLEENWEGNYDKEVVREAIKKLTKKGGLTYEALGLLVIGKDEIKDIFGVELTK